MSQSPLPSTVAPPAPAQPPEAVPVTRQEIPAFLMCPPIHLATDVANNVWMRELSEDQRRVDRPKAMRQFRELYNFLAARALVYLLPSRPGLQDLTYVANLGIVLPHLEDPPVVISNFRSPPRRGEARVGIDFFRQMGLPHEVAPPYFEGEADLKHLRENVYVGAHGIRTSREALAWFERTFDMRVIPFEIDNEYLYHLDCSIFPIAREHALVCTEAADAETLEAIGKHAEIIDVCVDDADSGMTNCVRIDDYVLCASNLAELSSSHEDYAYEKHKVERLGEICSGLGLTPRFFNLSEFLKSGAMLSCMVMHLNRSNF
jgi:N-dimethylarginine dimethylaminohydrolase